MDQYFWEFLSGVGKIRLSLYHSFAMIIINIPLSIFLAKYLNLGSSGVIIGTCLCVLPQVFLHPIQYKKIISNKANGNMGQIDIKKKALLITGTIIPNSNFVAHNNIEQRRKEYMDGLLFYKTQFPNDDIYFLENSSYDFKTDESFNKLCVDNQISLLKFPISTKIEEGKGYQEFEMLDAAIDQLQFTYTYFIKITGRYKVLNLKNIVNLNHTYLIADSHKKHKVTQTNVFCVHVNFYQTYLKQLYLKANDADGIFIEHVVYDKLIEQCLLEKVNLFSKNPIITGFSGSYGGSLNRNKYKMLLRNIERFILKSLNIHEFLIEY